MNDLSASRPDPRELLEVAREAACAGGEMLLEWQGKFSTREKAPADLVTDADLASQRAIASVVRSYYPEHAFLGEETHDSPAGSVVRPPHAELLSQGVCWVVDPLDGTTNYVHGYPAWGVSVGVVVAGEIVAGVIFDPLHQHIYAAAKGRGATCNGEPMAVSLPGSLEESLLAMSLPPQVDGDTQDLVDFMAIVGRCQGIRRSGSAALNLAHVAQGKLDGHWARKISPWDVAAGAILVREAGGQVTASDGGPLDLANPHFLATGCPALHAEMVAMLSQGEPPA